MIAKYIYNPTVRLKEENIGFKKISITFFLVMLLSILTQSISINNIINMNSIPELQALPQDFPQHILIIIMVAFQLFLSFFNIISLSVIFRILLKFMKLNTKFKEIFFFVILAQIPILISTMINSFFLTNPDELILSIFSLGYTLSFFTDNTIILNIFNNFDIFNIWSVIIIATGINNLNSTYSTKKIYISIFSLYFIIKIILSSVL